MNKLSLRHMQVRFLHVVQKVTDKVKHKHVHIARLLHIVSTVQSSFGTLLRAVKLYKLQQASERTMLFFIYVTKNLVLKNPKAQMQDPENPKTNIEINNNLMAPLRLTFLHFKRFLIQFCQNSYVIKSSLGARYRVKEERI